MFWAVCAKRGPKHTSYRRRYSTENFDLDAKIYIKKNILGHQSTWKILIDENCLELFFVSKFRVK